MQRGSKLLTGSRVIIAPSILSVDLIDHYDPDGQFIDCHFAVNIPHWLKSTFDLIKMKSGYSAMLHVMKKMGELGKKAPFSDNTENDDLYA